MGSGNYIKLYRESLECEQFDDPIDWKIFCWCLLKANYKDRTWKGEKLKAGQFITGQEDAAEFLKINRKTLMRHLKRLESLGAVKVETNTRFTRITVVNFKKWQSEKNFVGHSVPNEIPNQVPNQVPNEIPTDKKDKEYIKKEKEEPPARSWEELKKEGFDD